MRRQWPLKAIRKIFWALLGLGALVSCIALFFPNPQLSVLSTLGLLIMASGVVIFICNWRCPHCRDFLPLRGGIPAFCPCCGKEIGE